MNSLRKELNTLYLEAMSKGNTKMAEKIIEVLNFVYEQEGGK